MNNKINLTKLSRSKILLTKYLSELSIKKEGKIIVPFFT